MSWVRFPSSPPEDGPALVGAEVLVEEVGDVGSVTPGQDDRNVRASCAVAAASSRLKACARMITCAIVHIGAMNKTIRAAITSCWAMASHSIEPSQATMNANEIARCSRTETG